MSQAQVHQLSDGSRVYYRSQIGLDTLLREFYSEELYDRHGIQVRDGDCIFDVGANIGFFLMQLNRSLKRARVFCFEPIPENFELLRKNAAEQDRLQATLCNFGLAAESGEAEFTHYPTVSTNSMMTAVGTAEQRRIERHSVYEEMRLRSGLFRMLSNVVPEAGWFPLVETLRRCYFHPHRVVCRLQTIFDVMDEHNVDKLDLLKIDVEGAEQHVLDGIGDDHWPRIQQIVLETHFGREQADGIVKQLAERGFTTVVEPYSAPHLKHLHILYSRRAPVGVG